jgi:hypothetical protein
MKMKHLLPILILIFSFTLLGQTQTATTTDGRIVILKPDKTWDYAEEKKVPATIKIEPNYINFKGDNWEDLKTFLKLQAYQKGEFETMAQFKARFETYKKTKMELLKKNVEDTVVVGISALNYDGETKSFKPDFMKLDVEKGIGPTLRFYTSPNFGQTNDRRMYLAFSVSPEKAKNKHNIRFAIYGTPIGSFLSEIIPRKIVVFDTTTGEIFKEFNFENK